ncbi:hypothetical protein ACFV1L_20065 [Kitasatospora sp. NPDC059646]|uniref:HD domain-containing protein n=1 Tax=Kitasatospora sp. NPDC059646 TaxID=3346893 RepID=UPI00368A08CD
MEQGNAVTNSVSGSAEVVVQADHIGAVHVHPPQQSGVSGSEPAEEWARLVAGSAVWSQLRAGHEPGPWREQAVRAAGELAALRDGLAGPLADDPWQDPGVVRRFVRAVGRLLGEPGSAGLYPAEAAVLVLVPLLYRVRSMQLACSGPPLGRDGAEHRLLAERARTEPALARWLSHRQLARHADLAEPSAVDALLRGLAGPQLRAALTPVVVRAALAGLRRGPGVANREFLHDLPAEERVDCEGEQLLRVRRLVLLAALGYALAIEVTALPEIVAEHLGIPDPVSLPELCRTLDGAHWGGPRDFPVLRAECHHEAVVAALHEYTVRADELLHAVQREYGPGRVSLPLRLSSGDVTHAPGTFVGAARFRLDERRMRSLLMGVQLYRDRDLAVRELYQNALDACRYRRARSDYLVRRAGGGSSRYEGRIDFEQGVDENGRAYLDCRDNGVGMGEAELRGVFSKAGERFAEQQELREERAQWRTVDPPVELYPNSRFGIGVLSYFMLADRIRVTTCRMGRDGELGPELAVTIHGPGHLFRIARVRERGAEPGTTVRLYLDTEVLPRNWSAVTALERVLGIAEFGTTATWRGRQVRWEPGRLRPRPGTHQERGPSAKEILVPWAGAPPGVQVVWCERGGGLLVDGLWVEAAAPWQGPAGAGPAPPVVVNLFGPRLPEHLSVDRREVLDDLSGTLQELLEAATTALADDGQGLADHPWLLDWAGRSLRIADLLAAAAARGRGERPWSPPEYSCRRGAYPDDRRIFPWFPKGGRPLALPVDSDDPVPEPWLLWRVLAHRPNPTLEVLAGLVPELSGIGPVLPALPSDQVLINALGYRGVRPQGTAERAAALRAALGEAAKHRIPHRESADRIRKLGLPAWWGPGPATVDELVRAGGGHGMTSASAARMLRLFGIAVPDPVLALAAVYEDRDHADLLLTRESYPTRWEPGQPVPLGHLAEASLRSDLPLATVAVRLRCLGLWVDLERLPDEVPQHLVPLLRRGPGPGAGWLDTAVPVPASHTLWAAVTAGRPVGAVVRQFEELGLRCAPVDGLAVADLLPQLYWAVRRTRNGDPIRPPGSVQRLVETWADLVPEVPSLSALARSPDRQAVFEVLDAVRRSGWPPSGAVPFAALFAVAKKRWTSPSGLAHLLASHGVPVSCTELPPELPEQVASYLCDVQTHQPGVALVDLLRTAEYVSSPLPRLADWLRLLGHRVGDPAAMVREAIPLVPPADGAGGRAGVSG